MKGRGVLKPSYTQRPAYFAAILGMMATISGIFLVAGFSSTKDMIELRQLEDLQNSLSQVIPPEHYDTPLSQHWLDLPVSNRETLRFYRALLQKQLRAVAFDLVEPGYSGPIKVLLGVNQQGKILGVRVLSHTETPGLGDKIEVARDDWILKFNGLSLSSFDDKSWAVKKDGGHFDQFSGATITPRAVVKAVKRGLLIHRADWQTLNRVDSPVSDSPTTAEEDTNAAG